MPRSFLPAGKVNRALSYFKLTQPMQKLIGTMPKLQSRGNRPLQMTFEQQLNALIYLHLQDHTSGRHLLQVLEEEDFAREVIAPPDGIKKSSFFEAINTRGLEQLTYIFKELHKQAHKTIPHEHTELGKLIAIDGSLINTTLSMHWADYRNGSKKAKAHLGFDLNCSIPSKLFLTDGKTGERPFVRKILKTGQTGVMDRGYQCHKNFDLWQAEGKHFVCRIKRNTQKTCIHQNKLNPGSIVFYDAIVLLGTPGINQTERKLRLIGFRVASKEYWVATDRFDLTAEQIAAIFKLRWNIEIFFAWWKQYLNVYHIIARSEYGFLVQILAGLITYLLLAIYCHDNYNEKVSIKRVRELQIKIKNEIQCLSYCDTCQTQCLNLNPEHIRAKT